MKSLLISSVLVFVAISTILALNSNDTGNIPRAGGVSEHSNSRGRSLVSCNEPDPPGLVVFYILGVLYVFISLAIVADELFVPALEVLSEKWELSEDVAGATLMAAGGSSPELATNFVATFLNSDVGFGTIVGSAVFNVLFVVGICAVLTKKEMRLNEWPLLRDSLFYMVAVALLAIFFGVNSGGTIDWYEALILHLFYWVYVGTMYFNTRLKNFFYPSNERRLTDARLGPAAIQMSDPSPDSDIIPAQKRRRSGVEEINTDIEGVITCVGQEEAQDAFRQQSDEIAKNSLALEVGTATSTDIGSTPMLEHVLIGNRPRVRTSIVKLLVNHKHRENMLATTAVQTTKLGSVVESLFQKYDPTNKGYIETTVLGDVLLDLGRVLDENEKEAIVAQIHHAEEGRITIAELQTWYCQSELRIQKDMEEVFQKYDENGDGVISLGELAVVLRDLTGRNLDDADVQMCYESMVPEADGVPYHNFQYWYRNTEHYKEHILRGEEESEAAEGLSLSPPSGEDATAWGWTWYIITLPVVFLLYWTVPDVRRPGYQRYCYVTFVMALVWMGGLSYLDVTWIQIIGATLGIPSVLMGLIFLALGTSVPDMLSAIIVAKQGKADQAVSSSVGSNVFDVCVGLAVPWLLYNIVYQRPVVVDAANILLAVIGILAAVVALQLAVRIRGFALDPVKGYILILLYFGYVGWQAGIATYGRYTC